eukprot:1412322-Alexandrium_andersonii.AAC.1
MSCQTASSRGSGPARRGPRSSSSSAVGGPIREVEAANIALDDIRTEGVTVHLCLPASKTDP